MEFYDGSTKIGEDTTAPYALSLMNVAVGDHLLAVEPVSAGITDFETEQVAVGVPTIKLQFFLRMRFTKP